MKQDLRRGTEEGKKILPKSAGAQNLRQRRTISQELEKRWNCPLRENDVDFRLRGGARWMGAFKIGRVKPWSAKKYGTGFARQDKGKQRPRRTTKRGGCRRGS